MLCGFRVDALKSEKKLGSVAVYVSRRQTQRKTNYPPRVLSHNDADDGDDIDDADGHRRRLRHLVIYESISAVCIVNATNTDDSPVIQ